MPIHAASNIRDIPNLDDRLVRYLEGQDSAIQQLLEFIDKLKQGVDSTVIPSTMSIREGLQARGESPLNVEALRGKLGESQVANAPSLSALPSLTDPSYDDGTLVSVSNVIYRRDRTSDPGSWVAVTSSSVVNPEDVQDIVGAMLVDSSDIDFSYNDGAGTETAVLTAALLARLSKGMMGAQFGTGVAATVGAGATNFTTLYAGGTTGLSATESNKQIRMQYAGVFSNLSFLTTSAQPGAGSLVFTVRKNGVDTAIVVTVAAGAAAGVFSDLVHTVSFVAGDLFSIKCVNNDGVTTSATFTSFSIEYDAS